MFPQHIFKRWLKKRYTQSLDRNSALEKKKLIIVKALYGLKYSNFMWHQKLSDNLRNMGFKPCYADLDLWMTYLGDYYEYIAVMVDDLLIFRKYPHEIIEPLHQVAPLDLRRFLL